MNKQDFIELTRKQIIASLLAEESEGTYNTAFQVGMASAVLAAGIKVIRVSRAEHIKAIKQSFPEATIIGWEKQFYEGFDVYITATTKEVKTLGDLNVACIAMDATFRKRPNGETLEQVYNYARQNYPNIFLMADCATEEELVYAEKLGFDIVATTLRGATEESKGMSNSFNNFEFPKLMAKKLLSPLIVEGGISSPQDAKSALVGAHAVVVGSAMTRPNLIAKKFIKESK